MATNAFGYEGSDLKFVVELTSDGFDIDRDDWAVGVQVGTKILTTITKSEAIKSPEDGKWYICINKEYVKKGDLSLVAYAKVPDADFDDGVRDEVDKRFIGVIQKV